MTKWKRLSLRQIEILSASGQRSKASECCEGLSDATVDVVNVSEAKVEAWKRNCVQSQQGTALHWIFQASGQCRCGMTSSQQLAVPEDMQKKKKILSGQLCYFMRFQSAGANENYWLFSKWERQQRNCNTLCIYQCTWLHKLHFTLLTQCMLCPMLFHNPVNIFSLVDS